MLSVITRSMLRYHGRNGRVSPRRVMIHKSTEFREEEALGCFDALPTCNEIDLVQVVADVGWRGAKWDRDRKYPEKQIADRFPVRRGSLLGIGDREALLRSEEHTSELQSLMRISYAVFCLKKKTYETIHTIPDPSHPKNHHTQSISDDDNAYHN